MMHRLIIAIVLLFASTARAAPCVPGPNYHCIATTSGPNAYVPNLLTVIEGDTVEFQASGNHPLRQVIRANPSTTAVPGGLTCTNAPCIKVMDASVLDADLAPIFHFICVNHLNDVMRGDITILPRTLFANGLED